MQNITALQTRELARVENSMALEIRKVMTAFKLIAIRRVARGDSSIITQKEIDRLVRVIAAGMAAASSFGQRRARLNARVVKASIIDRFEDDMSYMPQSLQLVTDFTTSINADINQFTRDLISENLPVSTMKRKLSERFAALGVSPTNAYQLENIARTQAQITYNAAKYREEQQDYIQEILWGYKYVTTGDERVRAEHAALEGVTLPKDDPFWKRYYPPNGWSCRCQVIPIFETRKIKRPPKNVAPPDPKFANTPDRI
jgi:SPP1 gp7 family putative phage head morphogenesis protein